MEDDNNNHRVKEYGKETIEHVSETPSRRTEDNHWVKEYGKEIIEHVYETPSGCIWLVGKENAQGFREGLVRIYDAEWGFIDLKELKNNKTIGICKPIPIFKRFVPCTLKELFDVTPVSSYFS